MRRGCRLGIEAMASPRAARECELPIQVGRFELELMLHPTRRRRSCLREAAPRAELVVERDAWGLGGSGGHLVLRPPMGDSGGALLV